MAIDSMNRFYMLQVKRNMAKRVVFTYAVTGFYVNFVRQYYVAMPASNSYIYDAGWCFL